MFAVIFNVKIILSSSNYSRQNIRRQCVTEQSSTDDSDGRGITSPSNTKVIFF